MAANLTGSAVAVTWASGASPAGQAVPVPEDCTAVYHFWSYWRDASGFGLAAATLAGAEPDDTFELPGTSALTATGVAVWYNPPTGDQTLAVQWSGAPEEGPTTIVAFTKGGGVIGDSDADADVETNAVSVTLTTNVGDLVLKYNQRYTGHSAGAPGVSAGWTDVQSATGTNEAARLSAIVATGTSVVCNGENEDYSTVLAIAIPAASEDEGVVNTVAKDDAVVVTDSVVATVTRTNVVARVLSDSVAVSDESDAERLLRRLQSDELTVTDLDELFRVREQVLLSEIAAVDETVATRLRRRLTTDDVVVTDVAEQLRLRLRVFADAMAVVDDVIATLVPDDGGEPGGPTIVSRVLSDSAAVTDVVEVLRSSRRALTDALVVADESSVGATRVRELQDALSVTDDALRYVAAYRVVTASLAVTDDLESLRRTMRVLTSMIVITDETVANYITEIINSVILHGLETLDIETGVETLSIDVGVDQEIG